MEMNDINKILVNTYRQSIIQQLDSWKATPPTPEERELSKRRREVFNDAIKEYNSIHDEIARLHRPVGSEFYKECDGCDFAGYEGEPPQWPCRTAEIILKRHNIEWKLNGHA